MAAVAAASAELLIIGWYIFRVLLQVSIYPGFGWERAPETRPGTLSPYRDCRPYPTHPIPIAAIPVYQNAAVVLFVPARSRAHILAQTLSPVRPRPAGNKDSGVRRSPAADDRDQRGKKYPLYSGSIPRREAGHLCAARLYSSPNRKFSP